MNQKLLLTKNSNNLTPIFLFISEIFISILIFGCGPSINFIKTGSSIDAKSKDCIIEVFNSKTPERKYEELGILESEGKYGYDTFEDVLPKL